MAKALVTGARGFIGSFLVEELLAKGFQVYCLLRQKKGAQGWLDGLEISAVEGDILDPLSLPNAVKNIDYVFHLAGLTKALKREDFFDVNVQGTINLFDAVAKQSPNLKRLVLVSSLAAVGPSQTGQPLTEADPARPISDYGLSKLQAEQAALAFAKDLPISIVRPPAVFGPRDRDVFTFFQSAKRGWWPTLSGGPRYASLIYVKDLVKGLLAVAMSKAAEGQTYFLCNDAFQSWDEVAELLADLYGHRLRKITVPVAGAFVAAALSELFGKISQKPAVMNLDKFCELRAISWICDNSKAKRECGFQIDHDLTTAFAETLDWYQTQGWL